ncbi:hypothetical protein NL676_039199 [Syzygium grande]|nr:hypothetical protein NL676_039199 [Syzygium grande]
MKPVEREQYYDGDCTWKYFFCGVTITWVKPFPRRRCLHHKSLSSQTLVDGVTLNLPRSIATLSLFHRRDAEPSAFHRDTEPSAFCRDAEPLAPVATPSPFHHFAYLVFCYLQESGLSALIPICWGILE